MPYSKVIIKSDSLNFHVMAYLQWLTGYAFFINSSILRRRSLTNHAFSTLRFSDEDSCIRLNDSQIVQSRILLGVSNLWLSQFCWYSYSMRCINAVCKILYCKNLPRNRFSTVVSDHQEASREFGRPAKIFEKNTRLIIFVQCKKWLWPQKQEENLPVCIGKSKKFPAAFKHCWQ